MAAYTYPGVYIRELPSGQNTITPVATSIAAFIGWANQGPVGEAVMIESWQEYIATFGGFYPGAYLGYAVYQFFQNGGSQAYIIRLVAPSQAGINTTALPPQAPTPPQPPQHRSLLADPASLAYPSMRTAPASGQTPSASTLPFLPAAREPLSICK